MLNVTIQYLSSLSRVSPCLFLQTVGVPTVFVSSGSDIGDGSNRSGCSQNRIIPVMVQHAPAEAVFVGSCDPTDNYWLPEDSFSSRSRDEWRKTSKTPSSPSERLSPTLNIGHESN